MLFDTALTLALILSLYTALHAASEEQVWRVTAVSGQASELPCYLNPKTHGDTPKLILWYKRGIRTPIFSYDGRRMRKVRQDVPTEHGQLTLTADSATLTLARVTLMHAGLYECRVEFFSSPSQTSLVNLTVIETPRSVEVIDRQTGAPQNGELGPYEEDMMVIFTCLARDGWPLPNVTWWRSEKLLDGGWEVSGPRLVRNDLMVSRLSRDWHNTSLTCSASNTNLVPPITVSTIIYMYLLPTSVVITGPVVPPREGQILRLRCTTKGSRPSAHLSWFLKDFPLPAEKDNTVYRRATTSTLMVNVSKDENGARVICRATNPAILETPLFNSTILTVHYPPTVRASLGPSLSSTQLKEGDDVYFTCNVNANPPATTITWYHEGQLQVQNVSAGVILSGDSLVVQKVPRARAGKYICRAANTLATVSSNPVKLMIRYSPECRSSPTTYFIYDRPIQVTCSVSSYPAVSSVFWRWNSSSEVLRTAPVNQDGEEVTAHLTVYPKKETEERALSCWAVNLMGSNMHQPCGFTVKVAKTPLPLSSCRLANITDSSLGLKCQRPDTSMAGTTLYRAEVYFQNHTLFANLTSLRPSFNFSQLDADTSYQIKVYVTEGRVTSQPVVVSAYTSTTSRDGVRGTRASKVGGCVGGLLVTLAIVGGALCGRHHCRRQFGRPEASKLPQYDESNPDVVPSSVAADETHDLLSLTEAKSIPQPPLQPEQQQEPVGYINELYQPLVQQQQQQSPGYSTEPYQSVVQQQSPGYSTELYHPVQHEQQQSPGYSTEPYQSVVQQQQSPGYSTELYHPVQQEQPVYQSVVLRAAAEGSEGNRRASVRISTYHQPESETIV